MSDKKQNAISLYKEGIRDGRAREAVTTYTGARYTQHSTGVQDGIEGFVAFFEPFIARNPERDIRIIRALEDGSHVFLHVYQSLNNGEAKWVTTDFFDTDGNDKIIEHWDVIAPYRAITPSGHTATDGPTEVVDVAQTEANKQLVRALFDDIIFGGNPAKLNDYISADIDVQHDSEVSDGLAHFKQLALAPDRPLLYQEVVLLAGEGNFVATLSKATRSSQPLAQVDLFRLENGLIVEHWGNAEAVPPAEEWANSGKF